MHIAHYPFLFPHRECVFAAKMISQPVTVVGCKLLFIYEVYGRKASVQVRGTWTLEQYIVNGATYLVLPT